MNMVTLKAGTRLIELGIVTDIKFAPQSRTGIIDIPAARGASNQDLGTTPTAFNLDGVFSGAQRFEYFQQLDRYRMLGRSLKLRSNEANTIVFLDQVTLAQNMKKNLAYQLRLRESLFKSISDCEDLTGWTAMNGGSFALEDSDPIPKEGDYCITYAETASDLPFGYLAPDLIDLTYYDYVALWTWLSNISHLDQAFLYIESDNGGDASYNFASSMTAAETWYRLLLHKSEFTVSADPAMDWSAVSALILDVVQSGSHNLRVAVDDVGAFE